jgi:tetratricopeptide (TPR) repeat protein
MRVRSVFIASVCTVSLAAVAAVNGAAAAEPARDVNSLTEAIESRQLDPEALARALIDRALFYQARERFQDAIDDYSAALRVDAMSGRTRAILLYNRGLAYQRLNSQAMAIEDFTNALFLDPTFAEAFHGRANALRLSHQYLFALADYEKALSHDPPAPHLVYFGEGLTFEALQRPEDAKRVYSKALALKPDYAPARDKIAALTGTVAVVAAPRSNAAAEPAFRPIVSGNHPIVTGAIEGPDLTIRKVEQPQAVAPSQELLAGDLPLPPAAEEVPAEPETPMPAPAAKVVPAVPVAKVAPAPVAKVTTAAPVKRVAQALAAPAAKASSGWVVQLSSQRDESTAWSSWKKLKAASGDLLANHEPAVVRADLGPKGIYFRLQVPLESRRDAQDLCGRLKARGANCLVASR